MVDLAPSDSPVPLRPGAFPPNPGHAYRERTTGNVRPGPYAAPFSPWVKPVPKLGAPHGPFALDKLRTLDPATFPVWVVLPIGGRADVARYHASIEREEHEERAGHLLGGLAAAGHTLTATRLAL